MKKYARSVILIAAILLAGCAPETTGTASINPLPDDPIITGSLIQYNPSSPSPDSTPAPPPAAYHTPPQSITDASVTAAEQVPGAGQVYATASAPAPQIVEKVVEVIKEVPVELPPKIVEVIKEVTVKAPLSDYDFSEREKEFRSELNSVYYSFFGMTIVGGHYGYNFYTKTECLFGYSFESKELGKTFYSSRLLPLFLTMDSPSLTVLLNELTSLTEEAAA